MPNRFRILRDPHENPRAFPEPGPERDGLVGELGLRGHLEAEVTRKGWLGRTHHDHLDLGWGTVTNVGVNCLTNDCLGWAIAPILKVINYHASGTGTTSSAASDYWLQTAIGSGSLTGSTNGYFTGTQTLTAPNIYKTSATFTYSASEAVTEWVLTTSNATNFSGTATSTTANSLTNTGASFTTSGNGLMGWAVEASSSAVNTPTTTAFGTVTTNTGTALTLGSGSAGGWWELSNSSASTPSGTTGYVVYPSTFDHLVFAAVNVASGDTIQFNFSLTVNSGG